AVAVSDLAEGAARRGDLATLIGEGVTVDDLAAGMGTIGYEVLTNLGRRYHRVYKGKGFGGSVWALRHPAPGFGLACAPHTHALNERYPTMARRETSFICQNCGAAYGRWQGKCDACGEWNTISEESSARAKLPGRAPRKGGLFALEP